MGPYYKLSQIQTCVSAIVYDLEPLPGARAVGDKLEVESVAMGDQVVRALLSAVLLYQRRVVVTSIPARK